MKLSEEQSRRLLHAHGIHVTEACDRCTRLLGPVRWTTRSLPGFRMRPLGWDNCVLDFDWTCKSVAIARNTVL